jgi:hypothetical protein
VRGVREASVRVIVEDAEDTWPDMSRNELAAME